MAELTDGRSMRLVKGRGQLTNSIGQIQAARRGGRSHRWNECG